MIMLTPELCRAARGLLTWGQRELARRAGVSHPTIAAFELGERRPYERTLRDMVTAFEEGGIFFIDEVEGVHAAGISLKWGVEAAKTGNTQGATTRQGSDKGGLDTLGWDDWDEVEPVENDEPLPPLDWTDDDRAEQIEHWRSLPEKWAALHEVSRQCLLRAMGVERL
jgi:transcriptional regulator with XRE-family HTH domain